jgi:hypothetical protein
MNDTVFVPADPQLRSFLEANPGVGLADTDSIARSRWRAWSSRALTASRS